MIRLTPTLQTMLALLAGLSLTAPTRAAFSDYTNRVVQIADESYVNRDPVVSATGLVAWYAYKDGLPEEGGGSEVFAHKDGTTRKIFDRDIYLHAAHMRPQVWKDEVVWQTTRSSSMSGTVTWVLREVPDHLRDIGPDGQPLPELPAWYSAADLGALGGAPTDFNLTPSQQTTAGPFTNVFQYSIAYMKGYTTNTSTVAEQAQDPDLARSLRGNPRSAPWFIDATNTARRKTIDYNELARWTEKDGVEWLTYDQRNDLGPSIEGELLAWQKSKEFPFGWEIMVLDGKIHHQLTTNFYYDMAPKVSGRTVAWYGWDGNDFEIFCWNADDQRILQVTSNSWDDVAPSIDKGLVAWEAYPTVEAEIFAAFVEKDGRLVDTPVIKQLSSNIDDDLLPVVWDGKVAWQSFDGSDFEIWVWDFLRGPKDPQGQPLGEFVLQTVNNFDDVSPDMRDGLVVWMGYSDDEEDEANWDAEIFIHDLSANAPADRQIPLALTRNNYEDKNPRTAGGYVVWQADDVGATRIYLAKPAP